MRTTSLPWALGAAFLLPGCTENIPDVTPFGGTENPTSTGDDGVASTVPGDDGESSSGAAESSSGGAVDSSTGGEASSSEDDGGGALCGDGVISGNEQCDCAGGPCTVDGLGGNTCANVADPANASTLTGGTLACNPASCKYDYSACTWCSDGKVNGNEGCEPDLPIAETCMSLGKGGVGDLACDAACQIDTAGCTECGGEFNFDIANCPGGWDVGPAAVAGGAVSWACGEPTSGPAMADGGVWATNLDGNYNNNESSYLRSPPIDLTACGAGEGVEMRVYHWFDFEGSASNADGGIVQISGNGNNWTTIEPTSGTLYVPSPLSAAVNPPNGIPGFSGNDPDEGTWVQSNFDVSDYAGAGNLQIRFVFGSDVSSTRAGWYIDRVEFVGSGA